MTGHIKGSLVATSGNEVRTTSCPFWVAVILKPIKPESDSREVTVMVSSVSERERHPGPATTSASRSAPPVSRTNGRRAVGG